MNFYIRKWQEEIEEYSNTSIEGFKDQYTACQIEKRSQGFKRLIKLIIAFCNPNFAPFVHGIDRDILIAEYIAGIRAEFFSDLK